MFTSIYTQAMWEQAIHYNHNRMRELDRQTPMEVESTSDNLVGFGLQIDRTFQTNMKAFLK